jgi:dTDP-glucose 4,6-dehydratase
MKILVTGGAGFIDSNFVRSMLERHPEDRVVNLDMLTYAGNMENLKDVTTNPRHEFVRGDVCDDAVVQSLFAHHGFDAVVHFAAESHVDRSIMGATNFVRTNVLGTGVLLEAAKKKRSL